MRGQPEVIRGQPEVMRGQPEVMRGHERSSEGQSRAILSTQGVLGTARTIWLDGGEVARRDIAPIELHLLEILLDSANLHATPLGALSMQPVSRNLPCAPACMQRHRRHSAATPRYLCEVVLRHEGARVGTRAHAARARRLMNVNDKRIELGARQIEAGRTEHARRACVRRSTRVPKRLRAVGEEVRLRALEQHLMREVSRGHQRSSSSTYSLP